MTADFIMYAVQLLFALFVFVMAIEDKWKPKGFWYGMATIQVVSLLLSWHAIINK